MKTNYLDHLLQKEGFLFNRLELSGIDNAPVIEINDPDIVEQETCLFHHNIAGGNEYLQKISDIVARSVIKRIGLPVVRFADGEYAFYSNTLHCNGLYRQAESVAAIRKAMPMHVEALHNLMENGIIAPLIFPGNIRKSQGWRAIFRRFRGNDSATEFLDWLHNHNMKLTHDNYLPFYVIYAYLTSREFARLLDGKKLCLINSDWNETACRRWFEQYSSRPLLAFAEIPAEYVATRWREMREKTLNEIPTDTDICLVGAGVGALPVCVDIAARFSIPAIDAGHVMNMMNDREDKSKGPRLYTRRKS